MKTLIQNTITSLATKIIAKHQPTVIAITGSVGKTSVKNAVATILSDKFSVRSTQGNYNNEFGVPLTIIGEMSPGRSVFGWTKVLMKATRMAYGATPNYPRVLVLEFGADKVGDISELCKIAQPDIAILTAISPVHAEGFGSLEKLMDEKAKIIEMVKKDGLVLVNEDDAKVRELASRANAPVVSYGFSATADVRAENMQLATREDYSFEKGETFSEFSFDVHAGGDTLNMKLVNLLGFGSASSVLAAIGVAQHLNLTLADVVKQLPMLKPEPGRLNPIAGIKGSLLLDDSYNAAPASMKMAVDTLARFVPFEKSRRVAVLGAMAELGKYSDSAHTELGRQVALANVDLLVTVGEAAMEINRSAIEAGIPEDQAHHFKTSKEAGRWMDREVKKGDIVLVKGSQSSRMEKVTRDLMANPLDAKDLLPRQSESWLGEE